MGKLIRMGPQERWLLRTKRLHWSRLLFLLGMLIIGSTYQHLRRPRGLSSLWAAVSSHQPIKLASRDLPSEEMMMVSSNPSKPSSEKGGKMLVPQASVGSDEATLSMTVENIPSMPKRTAKMIPTTTKNNYSPTAAGTERRKEDTPSSSRTLTYYTSTSSRQIVKKYIPTPRGEMKSYSPTQVREKVKYTPSPRGRRVGTYAPSTFMTMETSHAITPRTTVKDSDITATYKILETNSLKRIMEETTPTTVKGMFDSTPTFLTHEVETNVLISPRSVVEKNNLSPPRRVESNSSAHPWGLVGKNNLKTPQGTVLVHTPATSEGQVTISTMTGSSPAETKAFTAAWSLRNPSPRTSVSAIRTAPATVWRLAKKPSTALSTSTTPTVRAKLTTQVHHCVVVKPTPAMPTTPSPSLTTALFPEGLSPSPSVLPPSLPDLHPKGEYPPDLFSVEERRQGWVVLHIFGMMYVFVALAIVCDEYFVPALGVITDKLQISEDVAGATFMAAGGSAPELFTSLIGVFISHSNVGIGTIVGSAVFNILFVIGTCSLFSREILNLTWWPLFRDVSFYILDLIMLILFFLDSLIAWWESLLLLLAYAFYVFTMKWNKHIEVWVKEQLSRRPAAKVMALGDLSKESRKFFVFTFLGSIVWIAMFSYLMVWWAHQVGETIGISEEIMGLTILAAGTSIPDLITSVIVARKGLGDMAVSSSVGSNIFDITVGLPVPWLLFSLINGLQPVPVSSNGLFCAIVLLFLMLLFVISSIASCKWRMNKILGFTMFLLYFVFLIISVMLEDRIISCPVSV
uniref:Sodium/potassium/calcium exchanger 1 n=1 Tax=Nomascus leucogenys TaxID=61853 RepID=A0A2I3HK11_NOMLE